MSWIIIIIVYLESKCLLFLIHSLGAFVSTKQVWDMQRLDTFKGIYFLPHIKRTKTFLVRHMYWHQKGVFNALMIKGLQAESLSYHAKYLLVMKIQKDPVHKSVSNPLNCLFLGDFMANCRLTSNSISIYTHRSYWTNV